MRPTVNDVQLTEPVLNNILKAYFQAESRFIADRVFPSVPVDKDSGTIPIFTKKYWFTDEMKERAPGTEYPASDFAVSSDTYATEQWALSNPVPDEVEGNNQFPLSMETAGIRYLGGKALIRRERLFAAAAMATSVWETDKTVDNKWSDYSASDPVSDVLTGKRTISQSTGYTPNTMIMGEIVRDRLANHPDLLDRIKYVTVGSQGNVDTALAQIFNIPNIYVGQAIYNSANEGQTASMSAIFDDDALLLYVTGTPSVFEPSAGYSFSWAPGGGMGGVRSYYADSKDAMMLKFKMQLVHKVVATDLGYFFSDVTD